MKNKYKIGDLVIGNDTLGVVRNHVGVVEYISECYPTRQDQKNDTNKDIVYHVKFGSYGNFLVFRVWRKSRATKRRERIKRE